MGSALSLTAWLTPRAQIDTMAADASDPEGLRARMTELYKEQGAPGLIIYNAAMGAPDKLLTSSVEHLQTAYSVDVIGAIVVTQVAAPAMRAAGSGTIIVTGGGFADHPIPALATLSLGKAALRSAATMLGADLEPDGIRVGDIDDRRADRCRHRLRSREHRQALLGGRPFRRSLAGGVSLYRRIGRWRPQFSLGTLQRSRVKPRCSASHGPVTLSGALATSSGGPLATILPPFGPAPGPTSMM